MRAHKDNVAVTEDKQAGAAQSESASEAASDPSGAAAPADGASDAGTRSGKKKGKGEKRNFAQDFLSVLTSRVMTKGCQFLIGIVTARLVGPEGRGLIAALNVAPELALTFSQLGVRQSVAFYVGKKTYDVREIVPTILILVLLANLTAVGACLIYYAATDLLANDWRLIALALAPIPFSLLANYASGVFVGKQMIARFNRVNWVPMVLNLLFVVCVAWAADLGIYGIMMAALLAAIVNCGYALYLLQKITPLRLGFNRELASKLTRLGMVYAVALFVMTLNYRLPILLLQNFSDLRSVGIYSVGQTLALMIWEIPGMLSMLVFSRGVNAKNSDAFGDKVVILTRLTVLAGAAVALGCVIVGPFFIPLVYGPKFAESAMILIMLMPGTVAFMAFKLIHVDMAGRGRPWTTLTIVVPCILLNAAIGAAVVPYYGAAGTAAMTSASYVLATIIYIVVYARITHRSVGSIIFYRRSDFAMLLNKVKAIRQRG